MHKPFILELRDGVVVMPPGLGEPTNNLVLEADERGVRTTVYRKGGKIGGGYRSSRAEVQGTVTTWCGAFASDEIDAAVSKWLDDTAPFPAECAVAEAEDPEPEDGQDPVEDAEDVPEPEADEREQLEADYQSLTGRRPDARWSTATLRGKVNEELSKAA